MIKLTRPSGLSGLALLNDAYSQIIQQVRAGEQLELCPVRVIENREKHIKELHAKKSS